MQWRGGFLIDAKMLSLDILTRWVLLEYLELER